VAAAAEAALAIWLDNAVAQIGAPAGVPFGRCWDGSGEGLQCGVASAHCRQTRQHGRAGQLSGWARVSADAGEPHGHPLLSVG